MEFSLNISLFGMGYVGCVSAACLAADGHVVIGVDPNTVKVDLINQGQSPIVEPGLPELIAREHRRGRIRAITSCEDAIAQSELSFVCIGTPSADNGSLDLSFVRRVCDDIGKSLRHKSAFHTVVFRSTMLPGTVESVAIPALEAASGKACGSSFSVVYNPEFLAKVPRFLTTGNPLAP